MKRSMTLAPLTAIALMMAVPAFAQDTTAPDAGTPEVMDPSAPAAAPEVMPEMTAPEDTAATTAFAVPEGYTPVADWAGLTAEQLVGAELYAGDGSEIGDISDIALGADGAVTGVIVDVGGFLGMGTHTVSLTTEQVALYSNADADFIASTALDEEALKAMPEYVAPEG